MLRRIRDVWKLYLSELYTVIFLGLGGWLLGVILVAIIMWLDSTATRTAVVGTFLAAIVAVIAYVFTGSLSYGYFFNSAVSMGSTRKEFILTDGIVACLNLLIEAAGLLILYFTEKALCRVLYPGKECSNLVQSMVDYRIIIGMLLLLPAVRMLCGALILKFQKKAGWTLYALFMIFFCLGRGRGIQNNEFVMGILQGICGIADGVQIAAVFIVSCITVLGTVLLVRKQEVRI